MQRSLAITLAICVAGATCPRFASGEEAEKITRHAVQFESIDSRTAQQAEVFDWERQPDGSLLGQLVDCLGKPVAGKDLELQDAQGRRLEITKTNRLGQFRLGQTRPGALALVVDRQVRMVRVWQTGNAPPSARKDLLFVVGDVVRAQQCHGPHCAGCEACGTGYEGHFGGVFQRILHNPWLIGTGTAAAIAIPLATSDDDFRDGDDVPDAS